MPSGLGDHGEQRSFRNGAAAGDGRQPAAAPRPQLAVHAVVMDVGAVSSAPRGNSFRKHFEDGIVSLARQIAVGISTLHQREQFIFVPAAIIVVVHVARAPRPRLDSGNARVVCTD